MPPTGINEKTALTTRFLKRKLREYTELRAEIEALQQEANLPDKPAAGARLLRL